MASNYKGSVKIPSGLSRMGSSKYPLMDANDINVNSETSTSGQDKYLNEILDTVTTKITAIENELNTEPTLTYVNEEGYREGDKKYWSIGDQMNLKFNFTSPVAGAATVTILRNGFTYKNISVPKGLISVDLGVATSSASYVYTVSVQDARGNTAHDEEGNVITLKFTQILGGVTISSTFDTASAKVIYSSGVTNTVSVPTTITYAESGYTRHIKYTITDLTTSGVVVDSRYNCGTSNWSGTFDIENVLLPTAGNYTLKLVGEVSIDDETTLSSNELTYTFTAIPTNTIATTILDTNITDDTKDTDSIYITYRASTNIEAIKIENALSIQCVLYKSGVTTPVKIINVTGVTTGDVITWSIGRLSNGTYSYEIHGMPTGGGSGYNDQYANGTFIVYESSSHGNEYVKDGLYAYFNPNSKDNADSDPSVWNMEMDTPKTSDYYYIKLHDLNYDSNGWIVDTEDNSKMLKFTGDSYGELRYVDKNGNDNQFAPMSLMPDGTLGNSIEIMFRTRCIGQSDAVVMTCKREDTASYGGYDVKYNEARISSNQDYTTTSMVEDKWTHIVFVIDKNLRQLNDGSSTQVTNSDIEDMNPVKTMNIYVNGVRTKVVSLPQADISGDFVSTAYPGVPLTLNAYYSYMLEKMTGFGNCEIKTIRLYNKALKASEVITNYINANYSITKREELITKNDSTKANIPVIHFVRNCKIENNSRTYGQLSADKSFGVLNSITVKSSKDPSVPTSKNSWVNCTMWYTYLDTSTGLWKTVHYHDVDVYLQGTSSLQYPVKNYKIKMFKTEDGATKRDKTKNKIIPPNKVNQEGWYNKDSVYTLKCDYMEESHKNNTPTAMLYESVVDEVMDTMATSDKIYTPAKDTRYGDYWYEYTETDPTTGEEVEVKVRKYRDAVAGFPVLLYYNENDGVDSEGNLLDYNEMSSEEFGYYDNTSDTMVGTLMFNVDKTGKSLGFEVPIEDMSEMTDRIAGVKEVTTEESTSYLVTNPLDLDEDVSERKTYKYTDGTDISIECLPCVSIEGTSNSAVPSAASFFTMDEANIYTYKNTYLEPIRARDYPTKTIEEFYEMAKDGDVEGVQSYSEYTLDPTSTAWHNVYDYITGTFETRWAFTDEVLTTDNIGEDDYNELTYGAIIRTLNWFGDVASQSTEALRKEKFRNEFKNYFNYAYAMTYYLQMQSFIQVDNAGKNAMFDQWGDGKWCLRPYDMDTQMGENNSGDDTMHASAEINRDLSPSGITGNLANQADVSNYTTDVSHDRYNDYNTPNSRLWNYFGMYFKDEIQQVYQYLRNQGKSIYSTDYIVDYVESLTSDIIGESFYNKDASSKYLTQTYYYTEGGVSKIKDDMLGKLQGNRDCRYRQISEDRFKFLDSFFNNTSGSTTNTSINLRSDAASTGVYTQQIGISVYSPCYIKVVVGTDVTITAYIDTNETYTYNETEYEGVLFTIPLQATNKDITIIGAGNIKSINHMENLLITHFDCANASKITSIVITGSTALSSLSLGSNTYLRTLNLNACKNLGGSLNLLNCSNLKYLNFANTAVTSVSLPENGALETFIATNSRLTSLNFSGLVFLKSDSTHFDISGCDDVVSFNMNNCPNISIIDVGNYTNLTKLTVSNCSGITDLELTYTKLSEMSITSCNSLATINLKGCSGNIMTQLNLASIYNLKTLNISSATPQETSGAAKNILIYFPKYKEEYSSLTSDEIQELISKGVDVYWHTLKNLNCSGSYLRGFGYGVTTLEDGTCDFSQLTQLESLSLSSCQRVLKIKDISFSGSLSSLFYNCVRLASITGSLIATSSSADSLFNRCTDLSGLTSLDLNLDKVTNASSCMANMNNATISDYKYVLNKLPNVTNLGSFFSMRSAEKNTNSISLTSDLFEVNTKVTSVSSCFYGKKFTSIPTGLFEPFASTLTNAQGVFNACYSLTTCPSDLLKNCTALTYVDYMFEWDSALKTFFSGNYDIFAETNNIVSAIKMFEGCSALTASASTGDSSSGLQTMFAHLTKLTDGRRMFAGTKFITAIPDLLFEKATSLKNIDMMFSDCTTISSLPEHLFTNTIPSSPTHTYLQYARGLFNNCTSLSGAISQHLLTGAENLLEIGHSSGEYLQWTWYYCAGMFANTKIDGYDYRFLNRLTKLTSASFLFFHGSISGSTFKPTTTGYNNDCLLRVYADGNDLGIYNDIIKYNTSLKDVRYMFAGNTSIERVIEYVDGEAKAVSEPDFFSGCKNTLITAEGMFANCNKLVFDIPKTMFNNCTKLQNLTSMFAGCQSITGSLVSTMFSGCSNLRYLSYMFYDCQGIGTSDDITGYSIPSNLFDSCRTVLASTAHMFENCGFKGQIQIGSVDISYDEQGLPVYTVNRYGLLSDCTNLSTVQGMFKNCHSLKGAIPQDIFFTTSGTKVYGGLTDISALFDGCYNMCLKHTTLSIDPRNPETIYGDAPQESDNGYLVPINWVSKLTNLQKINNLFERVSCLGNSSTDYTVPTLELSDKLFASQNRISDASRAFAATYALCTDLTGEFLQTSLNYLTNVSDMFALSNLKSAGKAQYQCLFEKTTTETALNKIMKNMTRVFVDTYGNKMTGYLPDIAVKFSGLESYTSAYYHQTSTQDFSTKYLNKTADTLWQGNYTSYTVTTSTYSNSASLSAV